mmetsp:Transcript_21833/g.51512  ORF Transcript_21833/g.51512 Transcript_21833/m.51512 type:complete len:141 (+) Transcript_21833:1-423(+)
MTCCIGDPGLEIETRPHLFTMILMYVIQTRYGGERYEKRDMQIRVREKFRQLQAVDEEQGNVPWYVVNAAQSIEDVQKEINAIVDKTVHDVQTTNKPLGQLWKKTTNDSKTEGKSKAGSLSSDVNDQQVSPQSTMDDIQT